MRAAILDHVGSHVGQLPRQGEKELSIGVLLEWGGGVTERQLDRQIHTNTPQVYNITHSLQWQGKTQKEPLRFQLRSLEFSYLQIWL